ncbi:MAG: hypothetical protein K2N23_00440 [Clostridia bacterium]|nr:hypothetical protein [Clostridia bacterium]
MKEQILLYSVCSAISFASVVLTSIIKQIVAAIAKRCGRDLSGNVKEYIFAPMAILFASAGLYLWLDKFCKLAFDEKFILIVSCFSVGTMLLYLLLFQPTRKFAMRVIRSLAKSFKVHEVVEVVKDVLAEAEMFLNLPNENLQSNAEQDDVVLGVAEKPPDKEPSDTVEDSCSKSTDTEADKLRAMVEKIKNNT